MTTTTALIAFALAAGILTITPGLDTALVLRTSVIEGARRALMAGLGICAGCLVWGTGAALGLGSLLAMSTLAYDILRIGAAIYLCYLGARLLWRTRQAAPSASARAPAGELAIGDPAAATARAAGAPAAGSPAAGSPAAGAPAAGSPAAGSPAAPVSPVAHDTTAMGWFLRGCLTNVLNPKVGVFYITFLPQFIPQGADVLQFSLLLAVLHAAMGVLWFALLVAATRPVARWLARPSVARGLDRLTGGVFIAFGLRLALERR
ncbi:LysE family translocator [Bordetella genomosp. 5]|uniref:Lysine transporter LysE n=1 Tax=Bordetella genomosp. 5 TaxID=1395608 RepID=A0A261TW54_9BORD|nr:LysE family translocator [Bordetella genomosp. 5]OZI53879.1 hypothetical protein CAL25_07975 [Bordetella genomosp. 5]